MRADPQRLAWPVLAAAERPSQRQVNLPGLLLSNGSPDRLLTENWLRGCWASGTALMSGVCIVCSSCKPAAMPGAVSKQSQGCSVHVSLLFTGQLDRVLYSSATGASEPQNLAYMARLLPVGFKDSYDMIKTLKNAGGLQCWRNCCWRVARFLARNNCSQCCCSCCATSAVLL